MSTTTTEYDGFFQLTDPPPDLDSIVASVSEFSARHHAAGRMVVLITSGGTTIPLEKNTVRFLDNFSSGNRGSSSAEYFLSCGYAVVFLHRATSLRPFARHFPGKSPLEWLTVGGDGDEHGQLKVSAPSEKEESKMQAILKQYEKVKREGTLLLVPFTTLFQYMFHLRALSQVLRPLGPHAMIYLAAAVSDFYIHPRDMAEHKIQSSGQLQLHFSHTPKMIVPLRQQWAPEVFTVTFKLETDESLLIPHSKAALAKYNHQVVVANHLDTRRKMVTMVTADSAEILQLTQEDVAQGLEVEERIVKQLAARHLTFSKGDSAS